MNDNTMKFLIGFGAVLLLAACAVAKHFFPDVDSSIVGSLTAVGLSLLSGLGVYHVKGSQGSQSSQGGFASVRMLSIVAAVALGLTMLFGCAGAPSASQVEMIKNACAVDAGIRPTVTLLLAVPDLAKPEEIAAVTAARAVIDPICANPEGTPQANALAAVTSASAAVLGIVTDLQARKAK